MKKILFILLLSLFITSCNKTEEISIKAVSNETISSNIVEKNIVLDDDVIELSEIENQPNY